MFHLAEDPGQVDIGCGLDVAVTAIPVLPQRPGSLFVIAAVLKQGVGRKWRIGPLRLEGGGVRAEDIEHSIL